MINRYVLVIKIDITHKHFCIFLKKIAMLLFYILHQSVYWYISLLSAIWFTKILLFMLVNILLLQNYSHQICNLRMWENFIGVNFGKRANPNQLKGKILKYCRMSCTYSYNWGSDWRVKNWRKAFCSPNSPIFSHSKIFPHTVIFLNIILA